MPTGRSPAQCYRCGGDFGAVGRLFDMKAVWCEMAENLTVAPIGSCGHLPQEEQPDIVNRLLLDFLEGWAA